MAQVLNIARTLAQSRANGPGERFVVWVRGCSLRCQGCWNPDTWSSRPQQLVEVDVLADEVRRMAGIEGVTLSGGEPFEQAEALAEFAWIVRAAGLSVMAFTGYELEELESPAQRRLLAACDIVVAGRYVEAQRVVGESWRGSMNQSVHFLSDRYAPHHEILTVCEFHLHGDGRLVLTGFPPDEIRGLLEVGSSQAPTGSPSELHRRVTASE